MSSMDHSLIHIGLTTTMALAIVPSSHMTCIGWRGSTIVWWTLTSRSYKAIIRRVSRLLIPASIRGRTLSILRPIIGSISHRMRCPMRHSVGRKIRSGSRNIHTESRDICLEISNMTSRSMNIASRSNGRYVNLRHNWSSHRSTNLTHSHVPTRRTT